MRISELVKTYRLLSDPEAPSWNVRFVGALALVGLVAASAGGLYYATRVEPTDAPAAIGATGAEKQVLTEYVGLPPETPVVDSTAADAALAKWKAEHPGAALISQEPVRSSAGGVTGYTLLYRA